MRLLHRWNHFREVPETFPGLALPTPLRNQLLWDGECGFCAAMVARLRDFARVHFVARPYQEVQAELPPEILRWCTRQMHWVSAEGHVLGGSLALSGVLQASGRPVLAGFLNSPVMRPFTWLGYRLVAGHRNSLGRVAGAGCALPEKPKSNQNHG